METSTVCRGCKHRKTLALAGATPCDITRVTIPFNVAKALAPVLAAALWSATSNPYLMLWAILISALIGTVGFVMALSGAPRLGDRKFDGVPEVVAALFKMLKTNRIESCNAIPGTPSLINGNVESNSHIQMY
jgi:hypothetical protein